MVAAMESSSDDSISVSMCHLHTWQRIVRNIRNERNIENVERNIASLWTISSYRVE